MKKLKGFTLLELIIVMALMSILMVGIMNMFKPIRSVFVDSTLYESQRTTQNGMVKYITESTRYATNVALDNKSSTAEAAVKAFCDKLTWNDAQIRKIEVLYVDNATDNYIDGYQFFRGRLYRATATVKATVTPPVPATPTTPAIPASTSFTITDAKQTTSSKLVPRLALGSAYYGPYTYSISLTHEPVTPGTSTPKEPSLKLSVSSLVSTNRNKQYSVSTDNINSYKHVLTEGDVSFKNVSSTVKTPGIYDVALYNGNSTANGTITYILFTTDK